MSDYLIHYGVKGMKWRVHKGKQMNIGNMRYYGEYAAAKNRQHMYEKGVDIHGRKHSYEGIRNSKGEELDPKYVRKTWAASQAKRSKYAYNAARGKKIAAKLWLNSRG